MSGGTIHFVVPGPLNQRTGGYLYDARMVEGARRSGCDVVVHEVPGRFPDPDSVASAGLADALRSIPDGTIVVLDGLAAAELPERLEAESGRLRLLGLVHHPLADETGTSEVRRRALEEMERRSWAATGGVVVTSRFTAERMTRLGVPEDRIRVVEPGTESVRGRSTLRGGADAPVHLLCVGSLVPRKGQDLLVEALSALDDHDWTLELVGAPRDGDFARRVREAVEAFGLTERVHFRGEVSDADLAAAWGRADVFVLPSWYEGYGMALTEAAIRGLPIVTTTGGAIPYTVPATAGPQVEPGSVEELREALETVLSDREARARWSSGARAHGDHLPNWTEQVARFLVAVDEMTPEAWTDAGDRFEAGWLTLREPADHRARPEEFASRLTEWAASEGWDSAVDLGGGTGSNLRYLAPRLRHIRRWTVVDHDADLLARLPARIGRGTNDDSAGVAKVHPVEGDLEDAGLNAIETHDFVTASALLDLLPESWIQAFASSVARHRRTVLLALSYDGRIEFTPSDPVDEELVAAVNRHQRGEKGMGRALGPDAGWTAARLLSEAGMEVETAEADWRLEDPSDTALVRLLVEGWINAATEVWPERAPVFREWGARRVSAFEAGEVEIRVGHLDVLARPSD